MVLASQIPFSKEAGPTMVLRSETSVEYVYGIIIIIIIVHPGYGSRMAWYEQLDDMVWQLVWHASMA